MAGIGFRLQSMLKSDSYRATLVAYVYSAVLSSGPWLLSILSLALIGILTAVLVDNAELTLFRSMVIYTYVGTLILTGPLQLVTMRHVADCLYTRDTAALAPCYHWICTIILLFCGLVAGAYYALSGLSLSLVLGGIILFQAIALTWIGMIFLSAAKGYGEIVRSFALGYGLSVLGTLIGARWYGAAGMVWGFAIGQIVLVALLTVRIRLEFPSDRPWDQGVLTYWRTMPSLIVMGLFYNIGIWADKVVFWFGPGGQHVMGWIYVNPRYDTCTFLGYVSIVPALSLFLIRVETAFYKNYAAYFDCIIHGGDRAAIAFRRQAVVDALRLSMGRLVKLQGVITLLLLWLAPDILSRLNLPAEMLPTFRICLIASFVQIMLLILMIVILYFDWRRDAAILAITFAVLNGALSVISLQWDDRFNGCGYLLACLLTLIWGMAIFDRRMANLDYDTFTKQPMGR